MRKAAYNKKEKYVTEGTFEKHMGNIARSFTRVEKTLEKHSEILEKHSEILEKHSEILEKHSRAFDSVLRELQALREDNKYVRSTLSSFVGDVTRLERQVNNLTMRVEKLELKAR